MKNLCIALAFFLFSVPHLHAFLHPDIGKLFLYEGNIGFGYDHYQKPRFIFFTPSGKFLKEFAFQINDEWMAEGLLGNDKAGNFWLLSKERSDGYDVIASHFYLIDRNGILLRQFKQEGDWDAYLQTGIIYVAESSISPKSHLDSEKVISLLDPLDGKLREYVRLPQEDRFIANWTVQSNGKISLLSKEKENTYLENYAKDGRRVWKVPLQDFPVEDMEAEIADSAAGKTLVITNPGEEDSSLLVFSEKGKQEKPFPFPYLFDVKTSSTGEMFFLASNQITKLSMSRKQLAQWTYNPPAYGETWEEKWQQEAKAAAVKPSSSTSDLILALVYGNGQKVEEIAGWLSDRGPSAFPEIFEKYSKYPDTMYYVLMNLQESYPKEMLAFAQEEFSKGNYEQKKDLLPLLIYSGSQVPDNVKSFVQEMLTKEEDREMAEEILLRTGESTEALDSIVEKMRNGKTTEDEMEQAQWKFVNNPSASFRRFSPILKDSKDPLRLKMRDILLNAILYGASSESARTEEVLILSDELSGWISDPDPFVSNFAAVALVLLGNASYLGQAVSGAHADPSLEVALLLAFPKLAEKEPEIADQHSAEVLALAVDRVTTAGEKEEWNEIRYLFALVPVQLPGMRQAVLRTILNPEIPSNIRSSISFTSLSYFGGFSRTEIFQMVNAFDPGADEEFLPKFLGEVGRRFESDQEIRASIHDRLIEGLLSTTSDRYSTYVYSLKGLVTKEDFAVLLPLLDVKNGPCGESMIKEILDRMGEMGALPQFEDRLLEYLQQPDYAVSAAKILALDGNLQAMNVLFAGLQTKEDFEIEAKHFYAYGESATQQLMSLAGDPRPLVQERTLRILGELKSQMAYLVIRREFDDSLQDGKIPGCGVIAALMFYGENPWKQILKMQEMKVGKCSQPSQCGRFPEKLAEASVAILEKALMLEMDPQKAKWKICLLELSMFRAESREAFERLRKNHPVEEIREQIPTSSGYTYFSD